MGIARIKGDEAVAVVEVVQAEEQRLAGLLDLAAGDLDVFALLGLADLVDADAVGVELGRVQVAEALLVRLALVIALGLYIGLILRPAWTSYQRGWERITDCLLEHLARVGHKREFMLWGSHAQAKRALLPEGHLVLEAPHPSPLSAHRGFLGCGHFKTANDWLAAQSQPAIDWLKPQATKDSLAGL